ncbi:MAG: hypothetical protein DWQ01_21515 [Planctomycetota bacterium]|nr:MAG: hypothetical protein DWQ01_21515 [Planctomycetota bacterium]
MGNPQPKPIESPKMKKILPLLVALAAISAPVSAQTDLGPLNLPAGTTTLPLFEGFEVAAGVIPPYMAVTELDVATLLPDPEAWCNIGQKAPCLNPFNGSYALEMGLIPGSTNYHDVRNALVLGIDGTGYTGSTSMAFQVFDEGEESDVVDGVWISNDGVGWYQVYGDWTSLPQAWTYVTGVDLASTPVDITGQFYLAFVQEDNFPYLDLDGVGIDDIAIPGRALLTSTALAGGAYATVTIDSTTAGGTATLLASFTGSGPSFYGNVQVDLSQPIFTIVTIPTDVNGDAVLSSIVPANLSGRTIYLQGIVSDGINSNVTTLLVDTIL